MAGQWWAGLGVYALLLAVLTLVAWVSWHDRRRR